MVGEGSRQRDKEMRKFQRMKKDFFPILFLFFFFPAV
jgi:hypothetical protein